MDYPNKNLKPYHIVDEVIANGEVVAGGEVTRRVAKLFIWGSIGGWWGVWGSDVFRQLAGETVDRIDVYLSSGGGSVVEGFEIHDLLAGHPSPVNIYIFGIAASAATVVALSADKVIMSEQAMFMIHQTSIGLMGMYKADELENEARTLRKFTNRIISLYERKTELPRDLLEEMMTRDEWFEPAEAKAAGFIHEVVDKIEVPFDLAAITEEQFEDDFEVHTAKYARRILSKSGYVQASFDPGTIQSPDFSNTNDNSNDMLKQVFGFLAGLGLTISNKEGKALNEETFAAATEGKEEEFFNLLQPEAAENAKELVATAMADFKSEMEAKITEATKESSEVADLKAELDALKAEVAKGKSGAPAGGRKNDNAGGTAIEGKKPEGEQRLAFGTDSRTFDQLVGSKVIDAKAVKDLEARVRAKRKEKAGA